MMIMLLSGCGTKIFPLKIDNTCSVRPIEAYTDAIRMSVAQSNLSDEMVEWLGEDDILHTKHNDVIKSEC